MRERNGEWGKERAVREKKLRAGKTAAGGKKAVLMQEGRKNAWENIISCNKFRRWSRYDHWIVPVFFCSDEALLREDA